jgi:Arc/MetJ-type ribon-helix-helix transcriptional regulator
LTKKSQHKRGVMGRPPIPPELRTSRRVTVRLYRHDEQLLEQLCTKFDANEGEVIRTALRLLARMQTIAQRQPAE